MRENITHRIVTAGLALLASLAMFAPSAEARRIVQGPGDRVYRVQEFRAQGMQAAFTRSAEMQGLAYSTFVIEASDPATGRTAYLAPPGVGKGINATSPGIDVDPVSGELIVIWSGERDLQSEIHLARYDGRDWSPAYTLTNDPVENRDPSFVVDQIGRVHLVWWEEGLSAGIRYSRFDPYALAPGDPIPASSIDLGDALPIGTGSAEGESAPGERFPFLTFDARSSLVYLAFSDPASESIFVLWFHSDDSDGTEWGGGQACVPVRISVAVSSMDELAGIATRPNLLTIRDALVIYWSNRPGQVRYVVLSGGSQPSEVRTLSVAEDASAEQIEVQVLREAHRMMGGYEGRSREGERRSGTGTLR